MTVYLLFLGLIGAERVVELVLSRRNEAWVHAHGGFEVGQGHFRVITSVHALFLPACALEVWLLDRPFIPWLGIPMLVLVIGAQVLRYWAIATLGRRWSVRVLVLPDIPVVTAGPYRFIRHPNYLAVVIELFAVPLVHTAWLSALVFTLLNLVLLAVRIRTEEEALARYSGYAPMAGVPRFVPRDGGKGGKP